MKTRFFQISSFCKTGSGTTPSRNKQDLYYGGSIPWVKSGELRESVIAQTEETVTEQALAETPLKIAPKGSVLVAMYGANVGRVGILGVEATTNQAVCHIVPDQDKADSRYLFHILRQKLPEFISKSVGGAQPNISQQIIRRTEIPLPPIAEQKRIAAILDKAEELRGLRRKALGELDAIVQSIFLEMFGDPVTNPMGWRVTTIGELAKVETGGTPDRTNPDFYGGSIPWVKTGEVTSNVIYSTEEHLTQAGLSASNCRLFPVDTIIVAMYGQGLTRGRSAKLGIQATTNQACAAILPNSKFDANYLWSLIQISYQKIRELGRGGNQPNLNLTLVKSFKTILPPIELQQEFARRVEAIEQLKTTHRESLAQLDTLFASLQHHAFQGTL